MEEFNPDKYPDGEGCRGCTTEDREEHRCEGCEVDFYSPEEWKNLGKKKPEPTFDGDVSKNELAKLLNEIEENLPFKGDEDPYWQGYNIGTTEAFHKIRKAYGLTG